MNARERQPETEGWRHCDVAASFQNLRAMLLENSDFLCERCMQSHLGCITPSVCLSISWPERFCLVGEQEATSCEGIFDLEDEFLQEQSLDHTQAERKTALKELVSLHGPINPAVADLSTLKGSARKSIHHICRKAMRSNNAQPQQCWVAPSKSQTMSPSLYNVTTWLVLFSACWPCAPMLTPTDLAGNLVPGSVAYANRKVLRELGCLAVEGLLACPSRMASGFIFSLTQCLALKS